MPRRLNVVNGAATPTTAMATAMTQAMANPVAMPTPVVPVKTQAELLAEIEALRAENEAIRKANEKAARAGLTLKISEKGALSVYGLGRFPATFYREQWEKLLDMAPEIKAFIQANSSKLKVKGEN